MDESCNNIDKTLLTMGVTQQTIHTEFVSEKTKD